MSSFRQIEANRRNARSSTGPVTEEGKRRSRQRMRPCRDLRALSGFRCLGIGQDIEPEWVQPL
jgi:hypothetical protein